MKESLSRALVPLTSLRHWRRMLQGGHGAPRTTLPQVVTQPNEPDGPNFGLVRQATYLEDTDQVRKFLPDILGRALARIWIDRSFRERFGEDPIGVMAQYDVHLPPTIQVELVTEGVSRPRIVVYETRMLGPRRRLLYLQMVMKAGT